LRRLIEPSFSTEIPLCVEASGHIFTSGIDGMAGGPDPEAQCRYVYDLITRGLRALRGGPENVVRLDHFTHSQGWLNIRQHVRAEFFGRPAPLASTGVAARLPTGGLLMASAWARSPIHQPHVVAVRGEDYGMPAIATAVRAGPFVFISGILKDGGWRARHTVDSTDEFEAQARGCFLTIREILARLELTPANIVSQDCYIAEDADPCRLECCQRGALGWIPRGRIVALPFEDGNLIEVTTVALAHEESGFQFLNFSASDPLPSALINLDSALTNAGTNWSNVARLEVAAGEDAESVKSHVLQHLRANGAPCPALIVCPGRPTKGSVQFSIIVAA
jgi:enamine deaminase RidA (YjgF/YER057c/UK114 family)